MTQQIEFQLRGEFIALNDLLKLSGGCDSGGAGKFRGGVGVDVRVTPLCNLFVSRNTDRIQCPPWGLLGGAEGMTNITLIQRNGKQEQLPGKFSHLLVKPGETVTFLTAGGGGYGPPSQRDADAVRRDLGLGYISKERVDRDYPRVLRSNS